MNYYPEFACLVNGYLQVRDRTPTWLARQLSVNPGTVNRWLNQEARPSTPAMVIRVADLLGVHRPKERQALLTAAGYGYQEGTPTASATANGEVGQPEAIGMSGVTEAMANGSVVTMSPILPPGQRAPHAPPFMTPALPPQGVLGREDTLARLFTLLALDQPTAANVPPVALHGMGGIGKTTLAIALGRLEAVAQFFPDGVLWVGVGPDPTVRNLLDDWGRALGVNLVAEQDAAACQERLRALLHQRRLLLIIDDVWEVAHGQAFMLAGPYCRTLLTTRESPAAYTLATRERTLAVDVLSPAAALSLLQRLAPEVVNADERSARRLCKRLEFLPLALTLAGRLLAIETDVPTRMQRLLSELIEHGETRLHLLQGEGRLGLAPEQPASLHAILGMSVARLSALDQERFALLAVFGAEPLTWELAAAAHVWACTPAAAETTIAHFIQRGLVTRRGERYWMHALLADYAMAMMG